MLLMLHKPRATAPERARLALGRAAARLAEAARLPLRALENRRLVAELGAMSDHQLRDIGLARGDVGDASALGGAGDAGLFLATRRGERRAAGTHRRS